MANESWKIEGEYFESCNCELLCPCLFTQAKVRPTEGHCDVVLAFHINRGSYGKTDLSGLNAVQAFTTPGPMAQGAAPAEFTSTAARTRNSVPRSKPFSPDRPADRRACWLR